MKVFYYSLINSLWTQLLLNFIKYIWLTSACKEKLLQSCPTLCSPMDCGLPGSSVHGIFQVRILEWVATSSSRASSGSRDRAYMSCVSCIGQGGSLPLAPPGKHRMWQSPHLNPCSPASVLCVMTQLGIPFSAVSLKVFLSWASSQDLLSQGKGVS